MSEEAGLEILVATKTGFKKGLHVGEFIDYKRQKYVVIQILSTNINRYGNPSVKVEFIAQRIGMVPNYKRFEKYTSFEERYNVAKGERELHKTGDAFTVKSYAEKPIVKISGIEKFEYQHTDLVVTYHCELVIPWSQHEMNKAIKENRLSTFKVISNNR